MTGMFDRTIKLCVLLVLTSSAFAEDVPVAPSVADYGVDKLMSGQIISADRQYKGVVKVEVDSLTPNYIMPWQQGSYQSSIGTAFLIGKKLFLTNAHVVSNAERIYLSQYGDSRKLPAKVKFVAHDCDLALVEVEDFTPFQELPYFELSQELPKLEDEVRAIGYPVGGDRLSVTRGVVSRIDFTPYYHPKTSQHLTIQIDAAINPGNSGGPVLMGNKVIGVAFQGIPGAQATGYVIPTPVIRRFLKDVKDGRYDRFVSVDTQLFPIINPAMRQALKLPDNEKGILVGQVSKGGSGDGALQSGDVILSVDGYDVDSSGMVELDGEKIQVNELTERCFSGNTLPMTVQRDGKKLDLRVTLKPSPGALILEEEYDKLPRYVVYGGLVFQPLQRNVLSSHKIPIADVALELRHFKEEGGSLEKEDVVIITSVLDDEVNARLSDTSSHRIVNKVNGIPVKGLTHLYQLLYEANDPKSKESPYITIETKGNNRPIVFDKNTINAANQRIASQYKIYKNARLDATRPVDQAPPSVSPPLPHKS